MATEKQIAASRRNGRKSRGPRTAKGKSRSLINSTNWGLSSPGGPVLLLPGESREEFEVFREAFLEDLDPVGAREEKLAIEVIDYSWRLARAAKIERGIFILGIAEAEKGNLLEAKRAMQTGSGDAPGAKAAEFFGRPQTPSDSTNEDLLEDLNDLLDAARGAERSAEARLASSFIQDAAGPNSLDKLTRYEAGLFRRRNQALEKLASLQAARSRDDEERA